MSHRLLTDSYPGVGGGVFRCVVGGFILGRERREREMDGFGCVDGII